VGSPGDWDSPGGKAAAPFDISVSPAEIQGTGRLQRSQRCFLAGKRLMQKPVAWHTCWHFK